MAWRKMKIEDLCLGLEVRLTNMADTAFNGATVISIKPDDEGRLDEVKLARPMAYTAADYNTNQAMLYAEHFSIEVGRLITIAEVWEGRDGKLRRHATRAA